MCVLRWAPRNSAELCGMECSLAFSLNSIKRFKEFKVVNPVKLKMIYRDFVPNENGKSFSDVGVYYKKIPTY